MKRDRRWIAIPGIWRSWLLYWGARESTNSGLPLDAPLDEGLTPVMAKEVIYQAVDYLGIGRVRPLPGCRQ